MRQIDVTFDFGAQMTILGFPYIVLRFRPAMTFGWYQDKPVPVNRRACEYWLPFCHKRLIFRNLTIVLFILASTAFP